MSLNSTQFIQTLPDSILNCNPLQTNQNIWWFDSLTRSSQSSIIASICDPLTLPNHSKLSLFWYMENTFALDISLQQQISKCLNDTGPGILQVYQQQKPDPLDYLYANPFTPGSRQTFRAADEVTKVVSIGYICSRPFIWGYNRTQTLHVVKYMTSNLNMTMPLIYAVNNCSFFVDFNTSPSAKQSINWLTAQQSPTQFKLIIDLCADTTRTTSELASVFAMLNSTVILGQTAKYTLEDCLSMRDKGIIEVFNQFAQSPTTNQMYIWFASRNLSIQTATAEYLMRGDVLAFGINYRIKDVDSIVLEYINFLCYIYLPASTVIDVYEYYREFYNGMSSFRHNASGAMNVLWFNSQNSSTQLTAVHQLCDDPKVDPREYFSFAQTFWIMDINDSVKQSIRECPKNYQAQMDVFVEYYVFYAMLVCDAMMLAIFSYLMIRYDRISENGKMLSPFNIGYFLGLASLIGGNVICLLYWNLFLSLRVFENVQNEQAVYYVLTYILTSAWNCAYLYTSYVRSKTLLRRLWPRYFRAIKILFLFSPIVFLLPVIFSILEVIRVNNASSGYLSAVGFTATTTWACQAASEIALLLLDGILLFSFAKFVTGITKVIGEKTDRFDVISRYGSVASGACVLLCFVSLIRPFATQFWPQKREIVSGSTVAATICMHFISGVLLGMKYRLLTLNDDGVYHSGDKEVPQ